jgi:hypothetical protein
MAALPLTRLFRACRVTFSGFAPSVLERPRGSKQSCRTDKPGLREFVMRIGCSDGDVKSKKRRYCNLFSCLGLWFPVKCWTACDEVLGCRLAYHHGNSSRRNDQGRSPGTRPSSSRLRKKPSCLLRLRRPSGERPRALLIFEADQPV